MHAESPRRPVERGIAVTVGGVEREPSEVKVPLLARVWEASLMATEAPAASLTTGVEGGAVSPIATSFDSEIGTNVIGRELQVKVGAFLIMVNPEQKGGVPSGCPSTATTGRQDKT